jgi:hypothetical protein
LAPRRRCVFVISSLLLLLASIGPITIKRLIGSRALMYLRPPRPFQYNSPSSPLSFACAAVSGRFIFFLLFSQSSRRRLTPMRAAKPPCVFFRRIYADISPPFRSPQSLSFPDSLALPCSATVTWSTLTGLGVLVQFVVAIPVWRSHDHYVWTLQHPNIMVMNVS